jgi:SOS-response transcriptional repressor LexA
MPSQEAVIKLARALNLPDKELLNLAGYAPKIDLLNVLEDKYAEITAAGQALTQQQRMSIIHAIEKADHPDTPGDCVPHIGNIRAGIPLLSEQNIIGYIDIPENLASKARLCLKRKGRLDDRGGHQRQRCRRLQGRQ